MNKNLKFLSWLPEVECKITVSFNLLSNISPIDYTNIIRNSFISELYATFQNVVKNMLVEKNLHFLFYKADILPKITTHELVILVE